MIPGPGHGTDLSTCMLVPWAGQGPGSTVIPTSFPILPLLSCQRGERTKRVLASAYQAQLPSQIIFDTTQKSRWKKKKTKHNYNTMYLPANHKATTPKEWAALHPASIMRVQWLLWQIPLYSECFMPQTIWKHKEDDAWNTISQRDQTRKRWFKYLQPHI